MPNQELLGYISKALSQGYEAESVRQALLQAGWRPADIEDAFVLVKGQGVYGAEKPREQGQRPRRTAGIIIISIVGMIFAALTIVAGIAIISFSSLAGGMAGAIGSSLPGLPEGIAGEVESLMMFTGILMLALGALQIIGFILLLLMRKAGMVLVVILESVSVAMVAWNYITSAGAEPAISQLVSVAIGVVIIAYLLAKRKLFSRTARA